ncbi:MAG: protein translocase subunit SecF [Candidatus Falkowbacteria bacterium]
MMKIIQKRKLWYTISSTLVAASIIAYMMWGLNLGIDFTGGALLEVKFHGQVPTVAQVQPELAKLGLESLTVQPTDQSGMVVRFKNGTEDKHQQTLKALRQLAGDKDGKQMEELRFESVGPSIGKELAGNARNSLLAVAICIILYIAWSFRGVSRPVSSWKYGVAAVVAMAHDVVIVIGVFAVLGKFLNVEVNSAFVAALLTVLGYSVNDTIVVFDRIRERLPKSSENFENTINTSINQTMVRSLNTSLTVLMTLLAIVIFGGDSIRYFALALFVGIFFGTYSSIFLASPILIWFEKMKK